MTHHPVSCHRMPYYLFLLPIHYLSPTEWQYRPGGDWVTVANRCQRRRQSLAPTLCIYRVSRASLNRQSSYEWLVRPTVSPSAAINSVANLHGQSWKISVFAFIGWAKAWVKISAIFHICWKLSTCLVVATLVNLTDARLVKPTVWSK